MMSQTLEAVQALHTEVAGMKQELAHLNRQLPSPKAGTGAGTGGSR